MKVSTNLTSGNMQDLALQAEKAVVDQAGGFISAAEQQAKSITSTAASQVHRQWQAFTGWLGSMKLNF